MKRAMLCLPVLFVWIAQPQTGVVDPGGWNKAKWGMNPPQLLDVFPDAKLYEDKIAARLRTNKLSFGIREFQIDGRKFEIEFGFDKAGLLNTVVLMPSAKGVAPLPDLAANLAKVNLLNGLTDKYGRPDAVAPVRDAYSTTYQWNWLLPQTIIHLTYGDYGRGFEGFVVLSYKRREAHEGL